MKQLIRLLAITLSEEAANYHRSSLEGIVKDLRIEADAIGVALTTVKYGRSGKMSASVKVKIGDGSLSMTSHDIGKYGKANVEWALNSDGKYENGIAQIGGKRKARKFVNEIIGKLDVQICKKRASERRSARA
jgi:hypothetical protein